MYQYHREILNRNGFVSYRQWERAALAERCEWNCALDLALEPLGAARRDVMTPGEGAQDVSAELDAHVIRNWQDELEPGA